MGVFSLPPEGGGSRNIMARPESIEDLSAWEKRPHDFLTLEVSMITRDVTVGAAVLALIDAARKSDVFDVSEDGEFKVTVPLTLDEIIARVRAAQRSWESARDAYDAVPVAEALIETWRRGAIDNWARDEGKPPIDWDAHDAAFAEVSR